MKELTITIQKKVGVVADGIIGSKTLAAICKALGVNVSSYKATTIKNIQNHYMLVIVYLLDIGLTQLVIVIQNIWILWLERPV